MKISALVMSLFLALVGCAGKNEQLAKCSADDSPVPALGLGPKAQSTQSEPAFDAVLPHDCGPMRPVNHF